MEHMAAVDADGGLRGDRRTRGGGNDPANGDEAGSKRRCTCRACRTGGSGDVFDGGAAQRSAARKQIQNAGTVYFQGENIEQRFLDAVGRGPHLRPRKFRQHPAPVFSADNSHLRLPKKLFSLFRLFANFV